MTVGGLFLDDAYAPFFTESVFTRLVITASSDLQSVAGNMFATAPPAQSLRLIKSPTPHRSICSFFTALT